MWLRAMGWSSASLGRIAAVLVLALAALLPDAARAQNATWDLSPGSSDFDTILHTGNTTEQTIQAGLRWRF